MRTAGHVTNRSIKTKLRNIQDAKSFVLKDLIFQKVSILTSDSEAI